MFSSNTEIKILVALVFALSSPSCQWRRTTTETNVAPAPFDAEQLKAAAPFQTKEPENYQIQLIVTTGANENKFFAARRGGCVRLDYDAGGGLPVSSVECADGKSFLMLNARKVYAETSKNPNRTVQKDDDWTDFLTNEWLNAGADARFVNLGEEIGLTKYRVEMGESKNAETIIYVDENIKLPVRQEFYSLRGERRTLAYTIEMRNFKLIADAALFEIPADYKPVSPAELQTIIKKEAGRH